MRQSWIFCRTATWLALIEHARNRLALILVVFFVPAWITLAESVITNEPVRVVLRADGQAVAANTNHLAQLSSALNAVTLIVGFMMFVAAFKSSAFDRRLALAGYPRAYLVLAKVSALVVISAVIAAYATLILRLYWQPEQPWLLTAGLFTAALTYGGIGVMLAALLRGELEGMFAIIMISIVDISLQSPVLNPAAESDLLSYLPSYGALQAINAAAFSDTTALRYLLLELIWFAAVAGIALLAFVGRTRDRRSRAQPRTRRVASPRA